MSNNSLNDIKQNILDLIELKKDRLRNLFQEQQDLSDQIVELESGYVKLSTNDIHLAIDNTTAVSNIKEKGSKSTRIASSDLLEFIRTNGPVSSEDIRNHFKCKSNDISVLGYLIQCHKIVKDGLSDKGRDKFSINNKIEQLG